MDNLNKKARDDIDRILAEVDATKPHVTGETPPNEQPDAAEPAPTRFIDIHVYNLPAETTPSDQEQQDASVPDASVPVEPPRPNRRRVPFWVIGTCLILLIGIGSMFLYPLFFSTATITIIPITRQIETITSLTVVTGQKATGAQQIPGNVLSSVTMSQQQTAPTTGKGHQDATQAHGFITFYNAATFAQVIPAGTMLTGADGVQTVTDQDATIPPVNYPTLGQATITAHSVITGAEGNIRAGDIYGPCCRLNVSAVNGAFTGGQLARDYQTVLQQDINNAASSLKATLNQSILAALKTQVAANETLITPVSCQQNVTSDHQAGTEATQVHIVLNETCTGATYNTESLQRFVTKQLDQQARKQLGMYYVQSGTIESTIRKATPEEHGSIALSVMSTANYSYQFTQEQQQQIKAKIAGKSKAQATSILLQTPGVQTVSLSISQGDQLPTENRLQLTFLVTM